MMGRTPRKACHNLQILSTVILAALVLGLMGLAGCGYKTMPVPPAEIVPQPITDLRYELNEKGVALYWTFPNKTVRGEKLTDISSFDLYRAVVSADDYCDTCPIPFGEPISLPGGAVAEDTVRQNTYTSTLLRPGHLYFFKVRSKAGWWAESEDSNIVSFMWNTPPEAPEKITAEAADSMVRLTWSPVSRYIDGTTIKEPVKYQIYRSLGTGPFAELGDLTSGESYEDADVVNGRKYRYMVKAVTMYAKGQVGGGSSQVVSVSPVDRKAPAVPAGVRVVKTATETKVIWETVTEEDLKGYRIYRRLPGDTDPVQIGEVNVPYTLFTDKNAGEGDWLYSVSSFDDSTPANESTRSAEASAR